MPSTDGAWGLMTMPALRTLGMARGLLDPGWDEARVEVGRPLDPPGEELDVALLAVGRAADETLAPVTERPRFGQDPPQDLGVDRRVTDDSPAADVPRPGLELGLDERDKCPIARDRFERGQDLE